MPATAKCRCSAVSASRSTTGEIVAILGANGAGKTTTLRAISGTVRRTGKLELAGQSLARRGPESTARLGVAHVPEGRGTFVELTVWENLRLGAIVRRGSLRDDFRRVLEYFPWLEQRRAQQAGTLSGGEQQMLALARAVMQRPKLLLLDEPSLGLAPLVTAEIFRIVRELNEREGTADPDRRAERPHLARDRRAGVRARGRPRRVRRNERGALVA